MASDSTTTNSPLLNTAKPSPTSITTSPSTTVAVLAALKAAFGLCCLLAPRLTSMLLLLDPVTAQAAVVTRLYGGALVSLGGLLWLTNRACARGEASARLLGHAVAVNIAADAVDVVSCTVGFVMGAMRWPVFGVLGGGCAALMMLGTAAYQSL